MKITFEDEYEEYKGDVYLLENEERCFVEEWAVLELLTEDILFVSCENVDKIILAAN